MAEPNAQDGAFQTAGAAQAGETAQVETQAQGEPEDGKGTEPTLETLQAELAASRAALAKLQNDLRANEGRRRRQGETDAELKALRDEAVATRKTITMLAQAMATGETEALPANLQRFEQEQAQAASGTRTQRIWDGLTKSNNAAAARMYENPVTAPELMEMRERWNEARTSGNLEEAIAVNQEMLVMASEHERAQSEAATAAERKAAKLAAEKAKREALEEAGVFNTDTGAAAAGAQPKDLETLVKVDTRRMTPAQLRAHDAALDAAIRRASW